MVIEYKISPQTKFSKLSLSSYLNPAANDTSITKTNFNPSNMWPLRAVVVQPTRFHSTTRLFAKKNSHHTCSTVLEVQNCKVPYKVLWFFLSKHIKKVNPVIQSHTQKHIIGLRKYQFQLQLLFEQGQKSLGSDWHTECYNQPTLSVADGK